MATSLVQVTSKARVGGLAATMVMLLLATTFYSVLSKEFGMLVFLHVWEVTESRLNIRNYMQRSRILSRSSWIVIVKMAFFIGGYRKKFWSWGTLTRLVGVPGWITRSNDFWLLLTHSLSVLSASVSKCRTNWYFVFHRKKTLWYVSWNLKYVRIQTSMLQNFQFSAVTLGKFINLPTFYAWF